MSLGILNNISAIYAENNLNNTQASLQKVLQQLSSGSRINSGADDAAGLAIANGLKSNEAALTQSVQNASDATGLLQTADGALSQVTGLLTRAVTLATEAANGTLGTTQVSSANQEYQSIIAEIGNIGGTTNFNGVNVFNSSATTFDVGDGTASGSTYFNDTVGSLSTTGVGQSVSTSTAPVTTNTITVTSVANVTIAGAKDTLSGTLAFSDGVAAEAFTLTVAAGTTLQQLAAQVAATGAVVSSGTAATDTVLSFKGATGVAPVITGIVLTDTQGTNALANSSFTTAATAAVKPSLSFANLQGSSDSIVGTLNVAVSTSVSANSTNLSITFAPGTSLQSAINQINGNQAFLAAGVVASNGGSANGQLKLTGPANGATGTTTLNVAGSTLSDAPPASTLGAGTSFTGSTLTTASAATVLATVNAAIANVSYQRGIIGAYANQLSAASNTAASENVNLTAAESSLRATNYGEATSNLAKFEVLSQTGISALAQANTVQQEILKLLQ